jgi:hypothetical protein
MRWPRRASWLLLVSAACAGTRPAPAPAGAPRAVELADAIAERAALALAADARLERADSLYAEESEIIADGGRRTAPPRFAGIAAAGQVSVGSSRVEVAGSFAWVLMEYRWLAAAEDRASEAQVTILFSQQTDGQWRISHAHSSGVR